MSIMLSLHKFSFALLLSILLLLQSTSADLPESSPAPSPGPTSFPFSPPSPPGAPSSAPSPSPMLHSPPAPPSSPSPAPSPSDSPSPAPAPAPAVEESDVDHENSVSGGDVKESSGSGHKVGVAFGVIAGAGLLVFGGLVYKKRRDNIRRAQHDYSIELGRW